MSLKIKPIQTEQDRQALLRAAAADEHDARLATHALLDETGRIVGAIALPLSPTVHVWVDSSRRSPREAYDLHSFIRMHMEALGYTDWWIPCPKSSPFHAYLLRLLPRMEGDWTMFVNRAAPHAAPPNQKET